MNQTWITLSEIVSQNHNKNINFIEKKRVIKIKISQCHSPSSCPFSALDLLKRVCKWSSLWEMKIGSDSHTALLLLDSNITPL